MNKAHTTILDVSISAIDYNSTLDDIKSWIEEDFKSYVCVAAVHLIMECQKDKVLLRGVNNSGLVTPDGMPLVWLSRFYGNKNVKRVYGPTLTLKLCKLAEVESYRVFLLGGSEGQSEKLKDKLLSSFSGLKVVGFVDTPVRPIPKKENKEILKIINSSKAQIVIVGIGCPTQELWMINNRAEINAPVLIGVGAAFDFISGRVQQSPVWVRNVGLEWLFRLIQEPRRLFYRYTFNNIQFLYLILRQLFLDFFWRKFLQSK